MRFALKGVFALLLTLVSLIAVAQPASHVKWTGYLLDKDIRAGESTQVVLEGTIAPDWYVYGPQIPGYWVTTVASLHADNQAPVTTTGENYWPEGQLYKTADEEGNPHSADVVIYTGNVRFSMPITVNADAAGSSILKFKVATQSCSSITGQCDAPIPQTVEIPLEVVSGEARADKVTPPNTAPEQPEGYVKPEPDKSSNLVKDGKVQGATSEASKDSGTATSSQEDQINNAKKSGIVPFFLLSLATGFLALLTPCVWPMIPVTVSYFSKQADNGKQAALGQALAYGLGIIFTFVGLGLVTAAIFGAVGPQVLAANVWVNLFLTVLFIVLAANLFGYYEILIPTKFVNKVQGKAKGGGFIAPILLGFVFSLTSFTCTVPFVGTILVSATTGDWLFPIVGMLGFSLAFAVPFFLLALAPQAVSKLPKSGTWMNTLKGFLGFVELAAAMKFLSNAELTFKVGFLTFPVYLAVWILIFSLAALYLFGLIKIPNDEGAKVGLGRKIGGVLMIGLVGFLMASINHPPLLGSALAFTPPTPYPGQDTTWDESYESALKDAKEKNKPVFLNFTGVTCANCRVMEARFKNNEAYKKSLSRFVLAELYTDRGTPEDNANAKLREDMTKSSSNPAYVIVTPDGKVVKSFLGLGEDQAFLQFLDDGYNQAQ